MTGRLMGLALMLLAAGAAAAQDTRPTAGPQVVGNGSMPGAQPADPGRGAEDDQARGGLAGRGGAGFSAGATYSATIGSTIGGTIGSTIGSQLPSNGQRSSIQPR